MLILNEQQASQLIAHAKEGAPDEVCGLLVGKAEKVEKVYSTTNADKSPVSFSIEGADVIKITKEIRPLGLKMLAIYHSHPETKAYPSERDIADAHYPDSSYVIISLKDKDSPQIRSFKIVEGKITEEELKIR